MINNISIIYQDNDLMVVDKPAGLLVHNPPNHHDPSVIDFIVRHIPNVDKSNWPDPSRPGIVHRLDKDTSGLMIIAKNPDTLVKIQEQFKQRLVTKQYLALAYGEVNPRQGSIVADISRHASKDKQTTIPQQIDDETLDKISRGAIRTAHTDYEVLKSYQYKKQPLSLVLAKPKTGRTHQIRIHLKHLGYPIIGDPMYFFKPSRRLSKELGIERQFLHAQKITFSHPHSKKILSFESVLPSDLQVIIDKLNSFQ